MKRLFRPRNLIIIAVLTGVVFFALKKKREGEQQLAAMSDDQVRDMVHDRVGGKVDDATENEIVDQALAKKDALAGSAASE